MRDVCVLDLERGEWRKEGLDASMGSYRSFGATGARVTGRVREARLVRIEAREEGEGPLVVFSNADLKAEESS